ncbi:ABC transporter permease [Faecalicatena contorta]|uniref:ABC transporter permease n=1 Tax=Faecalicatena contorta TaxID=39482 RepID=UPI00195F5F0C|nr:FtsX-like permease family protein [Faecalicatena contorta]MBM6684470.1 ABC transporter permease [Faecalicatena contorta]MBM6709217.1 ABC transporter permease [Faecalicatena contorta]
MYLKIAWKNVRHSFSSYALYVCSVFFILTIFFTFLSFSRNRIILEKISSDGRVETMCQVVGVFITAFVVFYLFFANRFFLSGRMRELGIYSLLGWRRASVLLLLSLENAFVCLGSFAAALPAGGLLHKGLTAAITRFLGLSIDWRAVPFIDGRAALLSLLFLAAAFVSLLLSNAVLLARSSLLLLVQMEARAEKPLRLHPAAGAAGLLLLIAGWLLALDNTRGRSSLWYTVGFSPMALLTVLLAVSGTFLLVFCLLPWAFHSLRRRPERLYRPVPVIVIPEFLHRIRSSAGSLCFLTLLVAGTLAVFGSTTLSVWYPVAALKRIIPSAIEYRSTDAALDGEVEKALDQTLGKGNYTLSRTEILQVTAASSHLPEEYTLSQDQGRSPGFELIRESDWRSLLALQGREDLAEDLPSLTDQTCILLKYRPSSRDTDTGSVYELTAGAGEEGADQTDQTSQVKVLAASIANPIGFSNTVGNLVISDSLFDRLSDACQDRFTVVSINGSGLRDSQAAWDAVRGALPGNKWLTSAWNRANQITSANSSTFLLITFVSLLLIIAVGSMLYFQSLSLIRSHRRDYVILDRMGYSAGQMKKVISRQLGIFYLLPYALGLLHACFALAAYRYALLDDILGEGLLSLLPILLAFAAFTCLYVLYFLITRRACCRICGF